MGPGRDGGVMGNGDALIPGQARLVMGNDHRLDPVRDSSGMEKLGGDGPEPGREWRGRQPRVGPGGGSLDAE